MDKLNEAPNFHKPKLKEAKNSTISTGERALAKEVKEIRMKKAKEQDEENQNLKTEFSWDKYQGKPAPLAKKVIENREKYGNSNVSRSPEWEDADEESIQNEIKNLYSKAKKEEMYGRMDGAKNFAFQALRLQGIIDKREKPVEEIKKNKTIGKTRADFVKIYRLNENSESSLPKTIYNASKELTLDHEILTL